MDIASIALHFLCAAVAGFLIMSIFGVQALVALCSSISLARRRKHQVPGAGTPPDRLAHGDRLSGRGRDFRADDLAHRRPRHLWISLRYDFVVSEESESDDAQ